MHPMPILCILLMRSFAKIRYPVVISHTVAMIDFILRPSTVDVQPCQTMGGVTLDIDTNSPIPIMTNCSSYITDAHPVSNTHPVSDHTGVGVVVKDFSQPVGGERRLGGHRNLHIGFGQSPGR